jgi:hypothetical protein
MESNNTYIRRVFITKRNNYKNGWHFYFQAFNR